jgi:hypothetical protein
MIRWKLTCGNPETTPLQVVILEVSPKGSPFLFCRIAPCIELHLVIVYQQDAIVGRCTELIDTDLVVVVTRKRL